MNQQQEIENKSVEALIKTKALIKIISFIYRQPLVWVFLSIILNMTLLQTCWAHVGQKGNKNFICGGIGEISTPSWFTLSTFADAKDNLSQSGDFNSNMSAKNLIDGDEFTQAYPSQKSLDYTIDLFELYNIERIEIKWGNYGLSDQYVDNWTLRGKGADDKWFIILQELVPQTDKTIINKNINVSALQLTAQSSQNWIGVYEIRLKGVKY